MSGEHNQYNGTGLEIAVIGMAGRFPGAADIDHFWENLENGQESISFFSDQELAEAGVDLELLENPNYVKAGGGTLGDKEYFDASFFGYSTVEAELMDPQVRVFHECAWHALENAGYDPFSYDGFIGLYAGASFNFYWEALSWLSGKVDIMGDFATRLLMDRDYLCTRVSYNLNLKGPSVVVKTACSTSLVAVHLACQAILNGECDMALAGGVTILMLRKAGYLYQEDMILSPDGHCRAFDARAKGTVGGDGVGIVVLKRLEYAITDSDHIHAVIKGTAINNDGVRRVGYTAPSVVGQSEVISDAFRMAEVEPETITYVEAHGTGTPVGDPIEIEALKMAFNTGKKRFCRIGSVKTNIGHLDSAAGVAGLIKTILALEHQLIPPSLYFEKPNPKIDFENSPFYVNAELSEWKRDGHPLRAGVSSFGIGGTNAHAVLEEAPAVEHSLGSRKWKLLLLSAKNASALERAAENLAQFLKDNPGLDLADAAYTLQVGRSAFPYRRMVVGSDIDSAVTALTAPEPGQHPTFHSKDEDKSVIFMFPGLEAQYVNMGLELYETEPVFREEMDRCFHILHSLLGHDIKEILYPGDEAAGEQNKDLHRVEIAQVVVFIFEYTLARLITSWGITPHAMIGYSFGEYTAACLSGVFSLESALRLIVSRGKLIKKMPAGAMLSVPLSKKELEPLLDSELSIAINNGPSCVVSGPAETVAAFEKHMKEKKLICVRLQASRALHSKVMEPILAEFEQTAGQVTLNKPQVPYLSNVTGNWIAVEDALNPAYWSKHLRATVQFADGIKELLKEPNTIFVEIGPGRDLSMLLMRHIDENPDSRVINLVRPQQKDISDVSFLLSKIGRLWLWGVKIDWAGLNAAEKRRRIPLPSYPFERQRYWIEGNPITLAAKMAEGNLLLRKKPDISDWFYNPTWKRIKKLPDQPGEIPGPFCWLLFLDPLGFGSQLVEKLKKRGHRVVTVKEGTAFRKESDTQFIINPQKGHNSDYDALFDELGRLEQVPDKIIHLWGITSNAPGHKESEIDWLDRALDIGFYSLLNIAQAIGRKHLDQHIELKVVTNNMQEVTGADGRYPEKAAVLGPVKVIPVEYPNIHCCSIDIDILPSKPGSALEKKLSDQLLEELAMEIDEPAAAFRGCFRWEPDFEPLPLTTSPKRASLLRQEGVYLITGGLGGIGLLLAEYLAKNVAAKLVLTGRSPFPPEEKWQEWLSSKDKDDIVSRKIRKVKELKKNGSEVLVFSADVTDEEQMQTVVTQTLKTFGRVNGVIHSAGLPDGEVIQRRTVESTGNVLAAKIKGTVILDRILENLSLDFFVFCSSTASLLGGIGQVGYCAANNFLDAFAHYKRSNDHNGTFPISINWDRWQNVGIATIAEEMHKRLTGEDLPGGFTGREGMEVFERILGHPLPQVVVSSRDFGVLLKEAGKPMSFRGDIKEPDALGVTGHVNQRPELDTEFAAPRNEIEQTLANIWSRFFGFEPVGISDDFFELGGDSLKALILLPKIHKALDVEVPLTEFFTRLTIENLAEYIMHAGKRAFTGVPLAEKKEYYILSSAQKRLYILQQIESESIGYNEAQAVLLEGKIDKDKLEKIFRELIHRHESLRTSIQMKEDEPVQVIHDEVAFEIKYFSLNSAQSPDEIIRNFVKPFDLGQAPLLRVGLIKTAEDRHVLVMDKHHIITDTISHQVFVKEFMLLYVYENQELTPLTIQYKDYAEWQNSKERQEILKRQAEYWIREFEGEIPVLNLPIDFARPALQSFEGSVCHFDLNGEETEAVKNLAAKEETTLFMVFLALFYILLSKLSGQEDLIIGTPTAGRGHTDLQSIIGVFINTLALRNYLSADKTFCAFLGEIKEQALKSFENQDYQFEDLIDQLSDKVNRDMSRNPLFDVMFGLQNIETDTTSAWKQERPGDTEITDFKLTPYEYDKQAAQFDLKLDALEVGHRITFTFEYCTKLFKKGTIERFINYFRKVISIVIEDPAIKISNVEIISEAEKTQILADFNKTDAPFPEDKTIIQLFEMQVERTPHNAALIFEDQQVTYGALNEIARRVGQVLIEKGIGTNCITALMVERSIEMIAGIFGILKAGGAYLPIDPGYPAERIQYMLTDSSAGALLSKDRGAAPISGLNKNIKAIDLAEIIGPIGPIFKELPAHPTQPCYVIYTSGSTGKPKGVVIEHRSLVNRLNWMQKQYLIDASDTLLQKTSFTFDVSVWEIFWWALAGAKLCLLVPGGEKDPAVITDTAARNDVTVMHFVPSMLTVFLEYLQDHGGTEKLSCIRQVITSGEALTLHQLNTFNNLLGGDNSPHPKLDNLYGPTEATIDVSYFACPTGREEIPGRIPIGIPIDNTQLYVVDKHMHLQPVGVAGELCISGVGVARGYLNRPELTAEKFSPAGGPSRDGLEAYTPTHPTHPLTHSPLYKTGDLARWLPDGNIDFLGRLDHQVKIRGFRVELGEIESQLLKHERIREAVVLADGDGQSDKSLCAYIVMDSELEVSTLRAFLSEKLPDYMVPANFVSLEKIPITPNGKIDRRALDSDGEKISTGVEYAAPGSKMEKIIADTWKEVLQIDKVSIHDNFFDIGGHSLDIIKVNSKLQKTFEKDIAIAVMFRYPTISSLAAYFRRDETRAFPSDEEIDESVNIMEEAAEVLFKDEIE